jgi:hypothetical protein
MEGILDTDMSIEIENDAGTQSPTKIEETHGASHSKKILLS